jgi:hypothetical protein
MIATAISKVMPCTVSSCERDAVFGSTQKLSGGVVEVCGGVVVVDSEETVVVGAGRVVKVVPGTVVVLDVDGVIVVVVVMDVVVVVEDTTVELVVEVEVVVVSPALHFITHEWGPPKCWLFAGLTAPKAVNAPPTDG